MSRCCKFDVGALCSLFLTVCSISMMFQHVSARCQVHGFFPTCQVRVVRFYVSLLLVLFLLLVVLLVPPRSFAFSAPSRTSTVTICALCSFPGLSRNHLLSAFPARPPPRSFALSVPCRTSNRDHQRSVFP